MAKGAVLSSLALLQAWQADAGCFGRCIIDGPTSATARSTWLDDLKAEKKKVLKTINYTGGVYDQVSWTQSSWIQPQMHSYDRYFYDPITHTYTVQKFLKDLKDRYGGVDAILMWPTYPNIGVDDRNQFDYFRAMPGGLEGVKNVTDELKASGVRVLWPYNPWDTGTHREPVDDAHTFANLLKQTHADGFNGDTMTSVPKNFWDASKEVDYPLAFEPEGGGIDEELDWATMGWGYWTYPVVPVVDRFKYITSGKFMTNVCDRWAFSKTDNLQMAWFNGDGYESWENVWGTWNGITPYDGEAIRRVATMLRYLGKEGFMHSAEWVPHTAEVWQENIFASKWPVSAKGATAWTIVNRGDANLTVGLHVQGDKHYYDCYHGAEIKVGGGPPAGYDLPAGYNFFRSGNCFKGNGGVEIDSDAMPGTYSVDECAAQCNALANCSCVTYEASSQQCWRRAKCEPAQFKTDSRFDTYLKAQGYTTYTSLNAFHGHGAVDIDTNATAVIDAAACMKRCDDDKDCGCVTMTSDFKKCWKRKSCQPTGFEKATKYVVYVNEARVTRPPAPVSSPNVTFSVEAHGFGCIMETNTSADAGLTDFLKTMQGMTQRSLYSYSAVWKYLQQKMVDIPKTKASRSAPAGKVLVRKSNFTFVSTSVVIEGDDAHGVDLQFPWEAHPAREHNHVLEVGPFFIDKYPVTTANYSAYLKATGFKPRDAYRWLKNWNGSDTPPASMLDTPVTYVSLSEARAYCSWAGARLPHVYEWQYAAQGTDGRKFPWGNTDDRSRYPKEQTGTVCHGPEPVTAHSPAGDSPFGVSDLIGNVWQFTDEFQDDHTRSAVLMGGSNYRPSGSHWYFPQAKQLTQHQKHMIMDDTYERAGTIGFRCVVDAADDMGTPIVV